MSTYYIVVISSRRSEYLVIKYIIYEYIYILLDKFEILYYSIPGKKNE